MEVQQDPGGSVISRNGSTASATSLSRLEEIYLQGQREFTAAPPVSLYSSILPYAQVSI